MSSLFTRIIDGEIPGRFVYADPQVVAFLTIAPVRPGHTLVVPRLEIEDWLALNDDTRTALFAVAGFVGHAVRAGCGCERDAHVPLGLEVRHVHLHLIPVDAESDLDFRRADTDPDPAALDEAAARIRAALAGAGPA